MCPECLSKDSIIWDYKNGVIVCSACGVVIDRLYDYETNRLNVITRDQKEQTSLDYKEKVRRTSKHLRTCKSRINEYYKIIRRFNLRPGVRVRDEVIQEIALGKKVRLVKTLVKDNAVELSKVLEGAELEQVKIILDLLNEYPRLASRTDRVKQALAVFLFYKIKRANVSYSEIARKFNVDPVNLMRAYKVLKSKYCNDFISNIKLKIPCHTQIVL